MNTLHYSLPASLESALKLALDNWQQGGNTSRLWQRDAALWSNHDEAEWLGWLDIVPQSLQQLEAVQAVVDDLISSGIRQLVLLGMGGSSMAPEVLRDSFGCRPDAIELMVLDSTDPDQIGTVENALTLASSAFIVASKSGSTLEPNILMDYFMQRMADVVGDAQAAKHFIAITDPGSSLEQHAETLGFRHIFHGVPSIGGRFSALSQFGVVPAVLIGMDCQHFLEQAGHMAMACETVQSAADHPGVLLGSILAVAARNGHDKMTLIISPQLASLGAWLEQLVAESTGKQGLGVLPMDGEPLGLPEVYGDDRVFVYVRLDSAADPGQDSVVDQLEQHGQPVVRINISDIYTLGAEMFRWEFATAVTGALLGVNPFDQPDVESSKLATRVLMEASEAGQDLPEETPLASDGTLTLFADKQNGDALRAKCGDKITVRACLKAHLDRINPGDYVAFLAYLERNDAHTRLIQTLREQLRDSQKVATCLGFGPRFLHSTGQYYKGGPDTGVFLQLSCDPVNDIPVPGKRYSFGVAEAAQGRGDFEVLADHGRRVLRVHLGGDSISGLQHLASLLS